MGLIEILQSKLKALEQVAAAVERFVPLAGTYALDAMLAASSPVAVRPAVQAAAANSGAELALLLAR